MTAGFKIRFQPFRVATFMAATLRGCWAQAQPVRAMPRVRSEDALIARLIVDATVLSETFRKLVLNIETTNGIVYIETGQCKFGLRACLTHSMIVAGPNRILRVVVDTRRDGEGLIGAIGHELQHAWEMLRVPGLATSEAIFFHALGTSATAPTSLETNEAIEVGERIEGELRRGRAEH